MQLTLLRSSVDKHLPRWPSSVQERSQVVIWICVSTGKKGGDAHNKKLTPGRKFGETKGMKAEKRRLPG